jgi:ABC-type ATPase with predicted acetyltransferase domain
MQAANASLNGSLTAHDIIRGAANASCNPWDLDELIPEDHPDRKLLEDFQRRQDALMSDFWQNHVSKLSDKRILKLYGGMPPRVRSTIEIYAREPDVEKAFQKECLVWEVYNTTLPESLGTVVDIVPGAEYVGELTIAGFGGK